MKGCLFFPLVFAIAIILPVLADQENSPVTIYDNVEEKPYESELYLKRKINASSSSEDRWRMASASIHHPMVSWLAYDGTIGTVATPSDVRITVSGTPSPTWTDDIFIGERVRVTDSATPPDAQSPATYEILDSGSNWVDVAAVASFVTANDTYEILYDTKRNPTNTGSGGGDWSLDDTNKYGSWTNDQWIGYRAYLADNDSTNTAEFEVSDNDSDTLIFESATKPSWFDNNSFYEIRGFVTGALSGTGTSGNLVKVTDNTRKWIDDEWIGYKIKIVDTSIPQAYEFQITSNDDTSLVFEPGDSLAGIAANDTYTLFIPGNAEGIGGGANVLVVDSLNDADPDLHPFQYIHDTSGIMCLGPRTDPVGEPLELYRTDRDVSLVINSAKNQGRNAAGSNIHFLDRDRFIWSLSKQEDLGLAIVEQDNTRDPAPSSSSTYMIFTKSGDEDSTATGTGEIETHQTLHTVGADQTPLVIQRLISSDKYGFGLEVDSARLIFDGMKNSTIRADNAVTFRSDNGRVGIGQIDPISALHVEGSESSNYITTVENTDTGANADGIKVVIGATSNDDDNFFIGFWNDAGSTLCGRIAGVTGQDQVAYVTSGTDFAEYFEKVIPNENFAVGQIVYLVGNQATGDIRSDWHTAAVVSNGAGFIGGMPAARISNDTSKRILEAAQAMYDDRISALTGEPKQLALSERDSEVARIHRERVSELTETIRKDIESGYVLVALTGRVPVQIIGTAKAGDYVMPDGSLVDPDDITFGQHRRSVGKALEAGTGQVLCAVGVR